MNNLNSILIEGNLVRDPQMHRNPKGTAVTLFSIESCRYLKGEGGFEKEVCFFDIEATGKLAEASYSKGSKGRGVRVVGRLRQDRWDGGDGKPRARIIIAAEHVEFRPTVVKNVTAEHYTEEEIEAMAESSGEIPPDGEYIDEAVVVEVTEEEAVTAA